ncbi:hypothetical protein MMC07_000615 [Pseudocyphellaria aurata]|nr:hypothetical protein [Pseudocyphellaria aurata]
MPKRKRGTEMADAQEPCVRSPLRKSARLLEGEKHQPLPLQNGERQRDENEENEPRTVLQSSSTTKSTRADVSRVLSAPAIAYLPEQRCPSPISEIDTETSTDDITDENHLAKTNSDTLGLGAGHKRKRGEKLGQAGIESRKHTRKSEPVAASPNLEPKERLNVPGVDELSAEQKLQSEETVPQTKIPVIESPEKPAKELEVREAEQQEIQEPISYWAVHHTWPKNFAEHIPMAYPVSTKKRQRTLDPAQSSNDEKLLSYAQSRKLEEVPQQSTSAYERHILTKGLDMDAFRGGELVSEESENLCIDLQQITRHTIEPSIFPIRDIRKILNFCRNRNEAIVNRDVTPILIPSITSLYFGGDDSLEHVIDEVNEMWCSQCFLEGPQIKPDLAIGLFSSAFTEEEIFKMNMYATVDNWTRTTTHMYFSFLMCEVKSGEQGLDIADRQNMHSCSVAVRAILRIQQAANKCRPEKVTDSLDRKILVFSISHTQQNARLFGHYGIAREQTWTYYRHCIQTFDLIYNKNSLLAIHNFVRNILQDYLPVHVRRLKAALEALPDPNVASEWGGLTDSTGLSVAASGIQLNEGGSQQDIQRRAADCAAMPPPGSSLNTSAQDTIDKLIEEGRRKEQVYKEEMETQKKEQDMKINKILEDMRREKQEVIEEMRREKQDEIGKMKKMMDEFLEKRSTRSTRSSR